MTLYIAYNFILCIIEGQDTLGNKSQLQVSVTSCSMCTTSMKTSRCDKALVQCTHSEFWRVGMWLVFQFNTWQKYMTLPHLLIYILSQRLVAEVCICWDNAAFAHFGASISRTNSNCLLNLCEWSQRQNSVAATRLLQNCTMSHEATCCSNLSPSVSWPYSNTYDYS